MRLCLSGLLPADNELDQESRKSLFLRTLALGLALGSLRPEAAPVRSLRLFVDLSGDDFRIHDLLLAIQPV